MPLITPHLRRNAAAPAFNTRKPPSVVYTLDQYVAAGVLAPAHRVALGGAVRARRNVLVAGGTASGKTTLVNAVLHEIAAACPRDRIVILEDTVELQCTAADCLALRTSDTVRLRDLVKAALRTSPDRLVVGEVRDESALDLLDAWQTAHPGGVATLHANDPLSALNRLDRLAQRANTGPQADLVADAIHAGPRLSAGEGGDRSCAAVRRDTDALIVLAFPKAVDMGRAPAETAIERHLTLLEARVVGVDGAAAMR